MLAASTDFLQVKLEFVNLFLFSPVCGSTSTKHTAAHGLVQPGKNIGKTKKMKEKEKHTIAQQSQEKPRDSYLRCTNPELFPDKQPGILGFSKFTTTCEALDC